MLHGAEDHLTLSAIHATTGGWRMALSVLLYSVPTQYYSVCGQW